jgi:hypothetical protein
MEDDFTGKKYWVEVKVTVPMTTNSSGKEIFDPSRVVVVQITNWKGENIASETIDLYKTQTQSIYSVKLGDSSITTGRAIGKDKYQFMASDRTLQNFLVNNIGKNYTYDTSYSNIVINRVQGSDIPDVYKAAVSYVKSLIPAQK